MRVLHVSSAQAFGGGERHLVDLAGALSKRGTEVHVAARPGAAVGRLLTDVSGVRVITLPLRNAIDVASALRLARYARRHRIDVIHAHLARDYTIAALAALSARPTRAVVTRHLLFPLGAMHRFTFGAIDKVICVSSGVADAVRASQVVPADKVVVIPNGVDIAAFERAAREPSVMSGGKLSECGSVVGTAGELIPHKGHEEFVEAARLVCARRDDVRFVIAGEDNTPDRLFRASLERRIIESGLSGRVRLLGWTDDVAAFYNSLDLFVSAARVEPFGLVITEAMASGRPAVVATSTDGAREIIKDGVSGLLVPVGDVRSLADAISRLLDDPDERAGLSRRALAEARERFSLDRMTEATEAVYREVSAGG